MNRWAAALRLVGVGAGLWLDTRLNTKPILVIVGLILGIIVAFYGVYQMLLPLLSNRRNKRSE